MKHNMYFKSHLLLRGTHIVVSVMHTRNLQGINMLQQFIFTAEMIHF